MPEDGAASFSKTVELGKELAKALPDNDILSRWMAHHIADLITRAESATGVEAEEIRRETATTILDLWAQRANFDEHRRPLAAFGAVFKALERLSAPQQPWHSTGCSMVAALPAPLIWPASPYSATRFCLRMPFAASSSRPCASPHMKR